MCFLKGGLAYRSAGRERFPLRIKTPLECNAEGHVLRLCVWCVEIDDVSQMVCFLKVYIRQHHRRRCCARRILPRTRLRERCQRAEGRLGVRRIELEMGVGNSCLWLRFEQRLCSLLIRKSC